MVKGLACVLKELGMQSRVMGSVAGRAQTRSHMQFRKAVLVDNGLEFQWSNKAHEVYRMAGVLDIGELLGLMPPVCV